MYGAFDEFVKFGVICYQTEGKFQQVSEQKSLECTTVLVC